MKNNSSNFRKAILILMLLSVTRLAYTQNFGIGTITPDNSAALEIKATGRGLLMPRTSSATRIAIINPAKGLMVYDITTSSFWFHNGNAWVQIGAGGNGWALTGNAGTDSVNDLLAPAIQRL